MIKESNQLGQQKLTFISNLGPYSSKICKMCVYPSDIAMCSADFPWKSVFT